MAVDSPQQLHEAFEKYFNSKDADGLLSLYEDEAVLLAAPGAPASGKEAIRSALEAFLAMDATITFIGEVEPMISGDLSLTHGRYRMTPQEGEPVEASTAEVAHRGSDGKWRYVLDNPYGTAVVDG